MDCIKCGKGTHVLQTRGVRRRRECLYCQTRFTTIEQVFHGSLTGDTTTERKPSASKVKVKAPRINRATEIIKARKVARDEIEKRKWDKESSAWWDEDNNFLPDRY